MSSDKIKEALVATFPGTSAKEWKRRSKSKVGLATHRRFDHPSYPDVLTVETSDGEIQIVGNETPAPAPDPFMPGMPGMRRLSEAFSPERVDMLDMAMQIAGKGKLSQEDRDHLESEHARMRANEDAMIMPDLSPIAEGDQVRIEAGTEVFELIGYMTEAASKRTTLPRATTATVKEVMTVTNWPTFAPDEHRDAMIAIIDTIPNRQQTAKSVLPYLLNIIKGEADPRYGKRVYSNHPALASALMVAQKATQDHFGGDMRFVVWGSNRNSLKAVHISKVTKVASADQVATKKAVTAKVKEQTISKRRLMVIGSQWRFTKDVTIEVWIKNPEIGLLVRKRNDMYRSNNSETRVGNTIVIGLGQGRGNTAAEKTQMDEITKQISALPPQVRVPAAKITAGTLVEVYGKIAPGYKSYDQKETNGLLVPVKVLSGSIETFPVKDAYGDQNPLTTIEYTGNRRITTGYELPYNQIEALVEAEKVPETIVYVLRDTKTGEFFGGWTTDRNGSQTNKPKMSKTFSGAKKYQTVAAVKASIRDFTGYNANLGSDADAEGPAYYMTGGEKKIDLPKTWEMVAIDKTTNAEKEVIDVQEWFKGLMRLRTLTAKHTSAVRSAFKKAEEAEETYEAILLFQNRDSGSSTYRSGETYSWDRAEPWEDLPDEGKAALAAIKKAGDMMGEKSIRVKTKTAVAYACSLADGVTAKMAFSHPDIVTRLLDMKTLEDVVEQQTETA